MEIEGITDEEKRVVSIFIKQLRGLNASVTDPMAVTTASGIVGECMRQMQSQRKVLCDVARRFDEFALETKNALEVERAAVDRNIEYLEAQVKSHPELVQQPSRDNQFRRMQLHREHGKMCVAAETYLRCVGQNAQKPTLRVLIAALEGEIPVSMIRKSYNLTKIGNFIREHKELFPTPAPPV